MPITIQDIASGLGPQRCAVCATQSPLLQCSGCKVVSYCGTAHQVAHRSKHKKACTAIRKAHATLEDEELKLRTHPGDFLEPADPFNTAVGHFWGVASTRDYMRARFAAADTLLKVDTVRAVEKALDHFTDMLRLCRSDNLGVRDMVPGLLLRLGREQECYDFLKWWANVDDENHYNGRYNWGNTSLPYLDIRNADPFESLDVISYKRLSLSQMVILTLLKLRLCLDLMPFEEADLDDVLNGFDAELDRPIGSLVADRLQRDPTLDIPATVAALEDQYRSLCRTVNDANPRFWEALGDEETPSSPPYYSLGSPEEAQLALYQCKAAWKETEDAIPMIDSATWKFTRPYHGSVTVTNTDDARSASPFGAAEITEKRLGNGRVFPSRFKPPTPISTPTELFPATAVGDSQKVRFICRTNEKKVLVYVDGACANNGQAQPRAGWAVVFGPPGRHDTESPYIVSRPLEDQGPFGDGAVATSNRAELRAAIAVLRLCDWQSEGFDSVVIATDSTYVINGATGWAKGWTRNGWKTRNGGDVKNRDLWELLLGEVEKWSSRGLRVELWKIPREWNHDADVAAKKATTVRALEANFTDVLIGLPEPTTARAEQNPRVLVLCLEYEGLFYDVFGSLVSRIASKAKMERATTQEAALRILDQPSPPSIILIVDGALTRRMRLWERVIDRLHEGATVVLAGCFSSMVTPGEFDRFFAKLGLSWTMGSYHRTTVGLRSSSVSSHLVSRLPGAYSQKAVFVKGAERSAAWYAPSEASGEAAVAFVEIGKGKLGYIGDVNGEEESNAVVLAMCGLLE